MYFDLIMGMTLIYMHLYSASFIGDTHEVVEHAGSRYPEANFYAVGWSLGANILVRYLGQQESHACPLSGAATLCNPFNLFPEFLKNLVFYRHALLFEYIEGGFNIPLAANAKSVRDFDEGLTQVSFGFKLVDEYYSNSSSSDSIK
ncbi:hypothetical protein REPUB_Repub07fG0172200 [Reevesia pubescens]